MSLYTRQKELPLTIPNTVLVVGVGGVGSWVALDFALLGTPNLILVDPDTIEEHNLNRTPFTINQVGQNKAEALASLILERRLDANVIPIPFDIDKVPDLIPDNVDVVMDCRDTTTPLPEPLQSKVKILGGYDGSKITFHLNPKPKTVWGQSNGYRTVPSWVVPPQFIASVLVGIVSYVPALFSSNKEEVLTFDLKDLFTSLFGG